MSVYCLYGNENGERVMKGAPTISIAGKQNHIPQHYFTYEHSLESIRAILCDISMSNDVLLFAAKDKQGMYIQVGIIGQENYRITGQCYPAKIVYGRRWRIDADTPTSEIIQTTMLAIQKVYEHEVRELLTIKLNSKVTRSAPLTSHQDIKYLKNAKRLEGINQAQNVMSTSTVKSVSLNQFKYALENKLNRLEFAHHRLIIDRIMPISGGRAVLDIELVAKLVPKMVIPSAFSQKRLSVVTSIYDIDNIMYILLDELIAISNRHVEEHFSFQNFKRFSRNISPEWLAEKSIESRQYKAHMKNVEFKKIFESLNYKTDESRTPELGSDALALINFKKLSQYENLGGHIPKGSANASIKHA
ncbi:hypothetical protein KUL17_25350 [Alteromonas sp. KUL17]|uniref:hypothetical protein n=1 Tax=Alteromonas sp. KUL17 TaxID=2480796 RepID=UPI0010DF9DE1|nr:hypothetical protein [Alteromonas sp. KUL17]TAP25361.1 hypothetical protein KUL49_12645 [Alteromonas sp. KUL17]GEA03638.1 hypothetical protein KUL17_25350 [Alteromonas sp. KUL17]